MNIEEYWVEIATLFFAVIALILSLVLHNPIASTITVLLSGFIAGRVFFLKFRKQLIFPFIIIIVGFLVGFLVGSFWTSRALLLIIFGVSWWGSYELHEKKYIPILKKADFDK
jgi:LPS O-antigen subunit length determinant protein (WzzB/FepE family)